AVATRSRIDALAAGAESPGFEFPASAGAGERFSLRDEPLEGLVVKRATPALPDDLAVPLEAVGLERGEDGRCRLIAAARLVHVLASHHPGAAGCARVASACGLRAEGAE